MPCIDILSHLRKSCSFCFPYVSHCCTSVTVVECALSTTVSDLVYRCISHRSKCRCHFSHCSC
uniref:Uncharacterized protein n=1 Tax=Anguilla anguilla TaxID=7936 RepID=A0A0E9W372_ANGAN